MYDDIKTNKIKTGIIVALFFAFISIIVYFICYICGYSEYALYIALIFSILSSVGAYYNSDTLVLASVRAREATEEEYKELNNILDSLCIAAGLETKPKLYVMDSRQPNAFATGRNPEHSAICVTTGLLRKLDYYELEGVIAHELSHIKNYDILLSCVISVMVGFVVILSDIFVRMPMRGSRRNNREDNGGLGIIMFFVGLIFLILAPIASKLIQLAVSRRREFLADASAVGLTRNPDGLISALIHISEDGDEFDYASDSTAHMFFESPFKNDKKDKKSTLFSTHPSIEERVNAIRNLK